jgi:hypothetical protein
VPSRPRGVRSSHSHQRIGAHVAISCRAGSKPRPGRGSSTRHYRRRTTLRTQHLLCNKSVTIHPQPSRTALSRRSWNRLTSGSLTVNRPGSACGARCTVTDETERRTTRLPNRSIRDGRANPLAPIDVRAGASGDRLSARRRGLTGRSTRSVQPYDAGELVAQCSGSTVTGSSRVPTRPLARDRAGRQRQLLGCDVLGTPRIPLAAPFSPRRRVRFRRRPGLRWPDGCRRR